MKKCYLFVSIILVTLIVCFACTPKRTKFNDSSDNYNFQNATIDEFYNELAQAQSCEMLMEMTASYQTINVTMLYDGNKSYQSGFASEPEQYREIIGNIVYTYTRQGTSWVKDSGQPYNSGDSSGGEEFIELFVGDNYTYDEEEDVYNLKEDADISLMNMEVKSMRLELVNDSCELNGIINSSGVDISFSLTIHELNNITITLPPLNHSI